MEINPVLEVYKANQNNTVMPFQIYRTYQTAIKARTLQKKGTSKARQLYHRWQQRCHYTFKCQVETMNQKERTSWIWSIGFTPNGLAIDDNGLCFQRMKWRPKIHHSSKKKQYKSCYHGVVGFTFQQFIQKPFKAHFLSSKQALQNKISQELWQCFISSRPF